MSQYCDAMDGPVATAARRAIETKDVREVLAWVPQASEEELTTAFDRTLTERDKSREAKDIADLWFIETVVRLHMPEEGLPFTGLKPEGLEEGPVYARAKRAIADERPELLVRYLQNVLDDEVRIRFREVLAHKGSHPNDTEEGRAYIRAFLEFTGFCQGVYDHVTTSLGHAHGMSIPMPRPEEQRPTPPGPTPPSKGPTLDLRNLEEPNPA